MRINEKTKNLFKGLLCTFHPMNIIFSYTIFHANRRGFFSLLKKLEKLPSLMISVEVCLMNFAVWTTFSYNFNVFTVIQKSLKLSRSNYELLKFVRKECQCCKFELTKSALFKVKVI